MEWSKHSFGKVKKQIREKPKLLERTEFKAALEADYEAVRILRLEVNFLPAKESLMWQQWAQALHLKFGDSNTRFFHNKASQRFRCNRIVGLLDDTNSWCTDYSQIVDIIVGFYKSLFTSARPADANTILEVIQPLVTEDMNINLTREFTKQKIDLALKDMAPLKTPGPDEIICCQIVHERQDTGEVVALSKGDNNYVDDRLLYALGQLLLQWHHIMGRAIG
ncbi:hypothetical protein CMV_021655 [Castanea mollissima]|nr:hypothetical protein CMV_021655 [Castanea mollissima]